MNVTNINQEEKFWYAISIHRFKETFPVFKQQIENCWKEHVDEIVVPQRKNLVFKDGKREERIFRLFGNYIFIYAKMDVYLMDALKDMDGITIVYPVIPIAKEEIEQYREIQEVPQLDDVTARKISIESFKENEQVYLQKLKIYGFVKGVSPNDESKISVEVDVMGTRLIDVSLEDIEKIDSDLS